MSTLKYYSGKTINLKRSVPFVVMFLIVLGFVLISYQPAVVLFSLFLIYAVSGFIITAWQWTVSRRRPPVS